MAAKPKYDGSPRPTLAVNRRDFDRMVKTCENAPRANDSLRALMAAGARLIKQ